MSDSAWHEDHARAVMVFLNGDAIMEPDLRGEEIIDDSFLVLFNAQAEKLPFTLPTEEYGATWTAVLDTDSQVTPGTVFPAGAEVALEHRSLVVLTRPPLLRRALTPVTAPDQAYAVTSANTPAASPADALPDSSVAAPAQKARS